jgi:hypothetical protein
MANDIAEQAPPVKKRKTAPAPTTKVPVKGDDDKEGEDALENGEEDTEDDDELPAKTKANDKGTKALVEEDDLEEVDELAADDDDDDE